MTKKLLTFAAAALAIISAVMAMSVHAAEPVATNNTLATIDSLAVDDQITLRRSVVRAPNARATVLFLHGFPETLLAWQPVTAELAGEFEIHAFDWPGFGQSSRPASGFGYAPRDYARILNAYIDKAGIDRSRLLIYATDIGALPALLAAIEDASIARAIIVGDFAPFDRPQFMQDRLQALKSPRSNEKVRAAFNAGRDEILANAMRRGLDPGEQFPIPAPLAADMAAGWNHGPITSADAFARYYAAFTRDQQDLETRIGDLRVPIRIVWGDKDIYINKAMGEEFAPRIKAKMTLLHGIGHYPHLQAPAQTAFEVRSAIRAAIDVQ